ncbi:MAG TPA: Gfo/Idh/MocA family oxidoreductase [Candidatus Avipropionibacterium avicola]|uniref:Gfo/Idh/MocA family oxidoreductase n=1 Tax=Candidatus Avipropionibacterium avicola TaxID=2840701 RepID=A0A9D1KL13_9ACTN|nr:Gfo/Idh/MocA family oxidoreductase [Candidatus Avipropionibacterium avicola]
MTVRVGIAGAGGISRSHISGLAATEGAEVTVVQDLDLARATETAATCGATATDSLDELLDQADAVFVCTPTAAHRPIVEQVVGRGLAVFCEKPLATDLAEAEAMGRAVAAAGVVNQVGLPLRRVAAFAVLRELMRDPDNGPLLAISMHTISRARDKVLAGWRGDSVQAGGGMLIEVGFHDVDLLQWFGGPIASATGQVTPGTHAGIEDAATVSLGFAQGGTAALTAAWNAAPVPGQSRRIHAIFDRAEYLLEYDGAHRRLVADGPGERHQEWDGDALDAAALEAGIETNPQAAFIRAVREGGPASPTVADAVEVHRVLDHVYRAAHGS